MLVIISTFFLKLFIYSGLTSTVVNQSSKYFVNCFSHENRGSSVDKNGASNGFNSQVKAVVLLLTIIGW